MLIATSIFLWHGFTASLGHYAGRQWAEASALAATYGVQLPADRVPSQTPMADEENFMGHPYLKSFIFEKESPSGARPSLFKPLLGPAQPSLPEALELDKNADFAALAARFLAEEPDLLKGSTAKDSAALRVLLATDELGIPWLELEDAATRPASRLPSLGELPPEDDFTAPENTISLPKGFTEWP